MLTTMFIPINGQRTHVISDIHGELNQFKRLLREIDYRKNDFLFINGDLWNLIPYLEKQPNSIFNEMLREQGVSLNYFPSIDELSTFYLLTTVTNSTGYLLSPTHTKQRSILLFMQGLPIN
ncbi:metallophosphoesterase [Shouchella patagoniensis]|uniref:metallophosphoesterase n=1 Tax=Shouchella patagoniensis TaxID=228576 RepID=UPI00099524CE|nr:metallophosphoesterase [Shouchella patagoniensis]